MAKETKFIATNVFMKSFRNEDVLYVRQQVNNFEWHTIHIFFSVLQGKWIYSFQIILKLNLFVLI